MNVMIVDDEMIERKAMKKFIQESFSYIQVVGEAANGRVAIELANELKPDLILMDIKMPGIDGLEAIRQIRTQHPSIKFIMVSAFDSFQYAKEAMKEGVKEYILKPSKKEETLEAILRVCKEIEHEKLSESEATKQVNESKNISKQHLLTKIIQNDTTPEIKTLFYKLFPRVNSGFFQVFQASNTREIIDVLAKQSQYELIIKEQHADKVIVLFLTEKKAAHLIKADALTQARNITLTLKHVHIGIGHPYTDVEKLATSFQQASLSLAQLIQSTSVRYGFPILEADTSERTLQRLENELLTEIEAGRIEGALNQFNLFYDYHQKSENQLLQWAFKIKQILENQGIHLDDIKILETESKEQFIDLVTRFCNGVILKKAGNEIITKAKTYIHEHYIQSLSLEEVAAHIGLTPTYFTKIFKEQTKLTFIDYVTTYRIERAKELLNTTNLSLKEIAFDVGYKDPNYFSRVFKKIAKCSPKKYRHVQSDKGKSVPS
ncbi:response regulator [Metabacillus herbersteinensis]|uniref:Response regulator n=1 Tax=Metabacillus herbersteinensis TaxID=283816 RepID=A0ABV6GH97_9BACI